MSCEKYSSALIEAAITGAELTPEVRSHVAACTLCTAALAQQRLLAAAIDANLHRQTNAPVPAATLQRIEVRLAQESSLAPGRAPRLHWLYVTATLATAAAAILVLLPRQISIFRIAKPIAAQPSQKFELDHMQLVPKPSTQTTPARPLESRAAISPHLHTLRASSAFTSKPREPEVLVPADERIALEHFMTGPHAIDLAVALVKRVPEQREQNVVPVVTPDIQIASLTVSPIPDTDVSANSSTNR